jgi:hypothetical protein
MTEPYYSDDLVTLYHGDAREHTAWAEHARVLFTDPPYGQKWYRSGTGRNRTQARAHAGIAGDQDTAIRDAIIALWRLDQHERPGLIFAGSDPDLPRPMGLTKGARPLYFQKASDAGIIGSTTGFRNDVELLHLIGRWPKRPPQWSSIVATRAANVGGTSSPAGRFGHPHAKPIDVCEFLVSVLPPGPIADPFAGAGSILVAARNLGRPAIGVELAEGYCETIARRLSAGVLDLGGAG